MYAALLAAPAAVTSSDWSDPALWLGLLTLTALEIVLGIDNVIFLSILAGRLRPDQQALGRRLGLAGAFITRIGLLFSLSWLVRLTAPLFTVGALRFLEAEAREISGRDLILILGGLFLLGKSTFEIHENLEGETGHASAKVKATFASVLIQIALLDIVFSLDSVITAVGIVDQIEIMIAAVVISIGFMMFFAGSVSAFVARHPTVKMLALSFLLLIGMTLVADGFGVHIPKGYIYFAMGFSVFVEMINLRLRRKTVPVDLHDRYAPDAGARDAGTVTSET